MKESYRTKLEILEKEKEAIVTQTQTFAKGLGQLQTQLIEKENAVIQLRGDLDKAYQEIRELQA